MAPRHIPLRPGEAVRSRSGRGRLTSRRPSQPGLLIRRPASGWGARPSLWSFGALARLDGKKKELGSVSTTLVPARPWPEGHRLVRPRSLTSPPGRGEERAHPAGRHNWPRRSPRRGGRTGHVAKPKRAGLPLPLMFSPAQRESEGGASSAAIPRRGIASDARLVSPARGSRPDSERTPTRVGQGRHGRVRE